MINIRRAKHADAQSIIDSHVRSIREVCSKDYTPEQIEALAGRNFKTEILCQTIDRDFVWVVEVNSQVRGFGQLAILDENEAEIMGLYLAPEAIGHGAGKKLITIMKEEARSKGMKKIQLYATITAKNFYKNLGFIVIKNDSIKMKGVQIPCFYMEFKI